MLNRKPKVGDRYIEVNPDGVKQISILKKYGVLFSYLNLDYKTSSTDNESVIYQ